MEEDRSLSLGQQRKLVNDCLGLYKIKGLSSSLRTFETIVNQPFDSVGSLSYVNERVRKQREDT
mgnify:FL=1